MYTNPIERERLVTDEKAGIRIPLSRAAEQAEADACRYDVGQTSETGRWGRSGARCGGLVVAVRVTSVAVLVSAAIDYPSLGYEQAERRRNSSRPVAHTQAGLG